MKAKESATRSLRRIKASIPVTLCFDPAGNEELRF